MVIPLTRNWSNTLDQTYILNYLTAYKLWALAGVPEVNEYNFDAHYPLCANIILYTKVAFPDLSGADLEVQIYEALSALYAMLAEDGLEGEYPFGGMQVFIEESDTQTHHLNGDRLEWIATRLEG